MPILTENKDLVPFWTHRMPFIALLGRRTHLVPL